MQQLELNLEGSRGEAICKDILKLESTIIFVSIGSFSGHEIAYSESPSMPVLVGRNPALKQKYCSIVASVVNAVKQSEPLFGKSTMITSSFEKNLRMIVLPIYSQEIFLFLITSREIDSKVLAVQILKLLKQFQGS
jgi:hypothetical protein